MITPRQAIDAWTRYRDGNRVTAWRPDGLSLPMGDDEKYNPDYYGFSRVEEALTSLCKLRSQRETLTQLMVHRFVKGLPLRSFNGAYYGWDQEPILENTIDAVFGQIDVMIKQTPAPEMPTSVEIV